MRKISLTILLISALHILSYAQSDTARLSSIAGKLGKATAARPVEKVHLQFNKPYYIAGDTIWFKGYTTIGPYHQPSALSGVLYVELINDKDKIVRTLTLKMNNGLSQGDIPLNEKLQPGNYRVRAYTNYMKNAGPAYFFSAFLSIKDERTNAIRVIPTLSTATNDNNETINIKLAYTDKDGKVYDHRPVKCEIRADTDLLVAVQGITDANGCVNFTFPGKTIMGQQVKVISHFALAKDLVIDKVTPLPIENSNIDVQFFPEGGELVNGVRSKVAFKAIGTTGLGVDIEGFVVDNENNRVAEFQSSHLGMGIFALTPQSDKTYTAFISRANAPDQATPWTIKLPAVNEKGFVLAVNPNPYDSSKLNVKIATNEMTLNEKKGQSFYIVGQSGGRTCYTTFGKLDVTSFVAEVSKEKFPSGIAQFTLFSAGDEKLNERLVFVENEADFINLKIKSPTAVFHPKEKVSLDLAAKNNNKPVQGSFSLTVYNEDETPSDVNSEQTILTSLLLTSDLKGNIEQPNYYFDHPNSQTRADLDILLLTQGYRRFEWKEILGDNYPAITYAPERGITLSGTITTAKNTPVAAGKVSVLAASAGIVTGTVTDEQGKFLVTGLDIADTAEVIIRGQRTDNDKNVTIKLDPKTSPVIYKDRFAALPGEVPPVLNNTAKADTALVITQIKDRDIEITKKEKDETRQLKEVIIKERKNAGTDIAPWVVVNPNSSNLNGPGHADKVVTAKDLESCARLSECLIARVAPDIMTDGKGAAYFLRHMSKSISSPPAITFVVDGVVLLDNSLQGLDAAVIINTVETIEVLKSNSYLSIYGTMFPGGALIITTKRGVEDPTENYNAHPTGPGIMKATIKGYEKSREFYQPKYTAKNINIADTRDAVYWNPNVITDAGGNFKTEFFNADIKGSYRVVVEGIDDNGYLGRAVYRYKVE